MPVFCIDYLDATINDYGVPEIFNTDQGSVYQRQLYQDVAQPRRITISMYRYLLL